jgi:RecJ-like exonuclease
MNVTEYLVKLADRLDAKGREDLANKVDAAIKNLKTAETAPVRTITCPYCKGRGFHGATGDDCGRCEGSGLYEVYSEDDEQDTKDPTTEELIKKLEQDPFQPSVSADEDTTDEEVAELWEE